MWRGRGWGLEWWGLDFVPRLSALGAFSGPRVDATRYYTTCIAVVCSR